MLELYTSRVILPLEKEIGGQWTWSPESVL
jgi:hypothetical protein